MNIRMMTISSVFAVAWPGLAATMPADERGAVSNPLRAADRSAAADDVPLPYLPQPAPATGGNPRSLQDFWRNPSWLRSSAPSTAPGSDYAADATAPSAALPVAGGGQPPAPAPRTLIQRIRDRRLAQLEKQAERLRQLSAAENRQAPSGRGSANLNGPENPDLQIDLGVPADAFGEPTASPAAPEVPLTSPVSTADWPPGPPPHTAVARLTELKPPAETPLEINIDLPSDIQTPQPKPALQPDRVRGWWSSPSSRQPPPAPAAGS